jgi:hypothetical protein
LVTDAFYQRGNALLRDGRADDALADFDAAIAGNPQHFRAFNDRGNALRVLDRIEDAVASYDGAIALKPDLAVFHHNRANALQDLGRFAEAFDAYNRAIALRPDFHGAFRGRGTLNLVLGRMREGFADFEHRLQTIDATLHPRLHRVPYWRGEDLAGKSILIYGDGAFGDLIQFCRYLPLLVRAGAQVTLIVPAGFRKILEPSLGEVRVISTVEHIDRPDVRCELMSLPFLFNTDLTSIPRCIDLQPAKSFQGKPWLSGSNGKSLNVGICWQGNPARDIDRGRSIPLIEFHPLSQIPGVRLFSLQKFHGLEQLRSLPSDMSVETFGSGFDAGADAFVDTAAVMAQLDLIVTSDTAIAHLAAALGRPVWIALKFIPEWRWMLGRNDSPWYPTMRLFRQRELYRWAPVFEDIAGALPEIAERKAARCEAS